MHWLILLFFSSIAISSPKKNLKIGIDPGYHPFSYRDDFTLHGFDVDVAHFIAKHLKRKIEFVERDHSLLLDGLKKGDYDIVLSGLEITAEHKSFGTMIPYTHLDQIFIAKAKKCQIKTLSDLQHYYVGVLTNSEMRGFLAEKTQALKVKGYESRKHLESSLNDGYMDVVLTDLIHAHSLQKKKGFSRCGVVDLITKLGISVKKGKPQLEKEIRSALANKKVLDKISSSYREWFRGGAS